MSLMEKCDKRLEIRVSEKLLKKLQQQAEKERRKLAQMVRLILEDYCK